MARRTSRNSAKLDASERIPVGLVAAENPKVPRPTPVSRPRDRGSSSRTPGLSGSTSPIIARLEKATPYQGGDAPIYWRGGGGSVQGSSVADKGATSVSGQRTPTRARDAGPRTDARTSGSSKQILRSLWGLRQPDTDPTKKLTTPAAQSAGAAKQVRHETTTSSMQTGHAPGAAATSRRDDCRAGSVPSRHSIVAVKASFGGGERDGAEPRCGVGAPSKCVVVRMPITGRRRDTELAQREPSARRQRPRASSRHDSRAGPAVESSARETGATGPSRLKVGELTAYHPRPRTERARLRRWDLARGGRGNAREGRCEPAAFRLKKGGAHLVDRRRGFANFCVLRTVPRGTLAQILFAAE